MSLHTCNLIIYTVILYKISPNISHVRPPVISWDLISPNNREVES